MRRRGADGQCDDGTLPSKDAGPHPHVTTRRVSTWCEAASQFVCDTVRLWGGRPRGGKPGGRGDPGGLSGPAVGTRCLPTCLGAGYTHLLDLRTFTEWHALCARFLQERSARVGREPRPQRRLFRSCKHRGAARGLLEVTHLGEGHPPKPGTEAPGTRRAYLGVIEAVFLLHPVPTERVVIETGVFKEADPLLPARWHIGAVVLVKVLPEESWSGRRIGRPREKVDSKTLLGHPTAVSPRCENDATL